MTATGKRDVELGEIATADRLFPWRVVDISHRPYPGFYSFNPSIHFDGTLWRCSLRCADYGMPGGRTVRTRGAKARVESKNALLVLDPDTWQVSRVHLMHERDDHPRNAQCASVGFEDLRLFSTVQNGSAELWAIAASLHLHRDERKGSSNPPEQVLLALDKEYAIAGVQPIRGPWSGTAQKNWMPFEGTSEPRFLYAIEKGIVFTLDGPERKAKPQIAPIDHAVRNVGGTEIRMMRRPFKTTSGKVAPPSYDGMRGGSQLLPLSQDCYLGIAHEMRYVHGRKWYWHTFFCCTSDGQLRTATPPVKLAEQGIEFAAGMAIDGDRLVVSFGVDDSECKLGITSLSAVLEKMRPVEEVPRASARTFSDTVRTSDPKIPTRVYAAVGIDPQPASLSAPAAADANLATQTTAKAAAALDPQDRMPGVSLGSALLDAAREAVRVSRSADADALAHTTSEARLLAAIEAYGDCFYDAQGKPR